MILSKKSLFGFSIYKHIKLSDQKITPDLKLENLPYPSITFLKNNLDLEYDFHTILKEKNNWTSYCYEAFLSSFLNLLLSNQINVYHLQFEKSFFGRYFVERSDTFLIEKNKALETNDLLTEEILDQLHNVENEWQSRVNVKNIIDNVIGHFIGESEREKPDKKFITSYLDELSNTVASIRKSKSEGFNFLKTYNFTIDESLSVKTVLSRNQLKNVAKSESIRIPSFKAFQKNIKKAVDIGLWKRAIRGD